MTATLEPPRWPGGPQICSVTNLPVFESKQAIGKFQETFCPSMLAKHIGKCSACGMWHAEFE